MIMAFLRSLMTDMTPSGEDIRSLMTDVTLSDEDIRSLMTDMTPSDEDIGSLMTQRVPLTPLGVSSGPAWTLVSTRSVWTRFPEKKKEWFISFPRGPQHFGGRWFRLPT